MDRAEEISQLLESTLRHLISFLGDGENEVRAHVDGLHVSSTALIEPHSPGDLSKVLSQTSSLALSDTGTGPAGLEQTVTHILKYSINTFAPGFLDKLYASPCPPGIIADLVLSFLNTNLHVYTVSPALTLIEKSVTRSLAAAFGLEGPRAGGISTQGGSASNSTSISIARNAFFPHTKTLGNSADGLDLVLFTSAHGHYSVEQAAQACGFGSASVISVPVDENGAMIASELESCIVQAKEEVKTPFYINATAGTTVLGSFDPFAAVDEIAKRHGVWLHVDGAWGGSFVFSHNAMLKAKLDGIHLADSIAINPHKMLGIPLTCSFLLAKDLRQFQKANTLRAGYLFHDEDDLADETARSRNIDVQTNGERNGSVADKDKDWKEPYDLADLTLQCGRRGDSLKMFMAWQYYGSSGFAQKIDRAYGVAQYLADQLRSSENVLMVSQVPTPCLQVCCCYAPRGQMVFGTGEGQLVPSALKGISDRGERESVIGKWNSKVTERMAKKLVLSGFMVDYAPALDGQAEKGKFFRVVINIQTHRETVDRLVEMFMEVGDKVVAEVYGEHSKK